jgi:hypothetical protein
METNRLEANKIINSFIDLFNQAARYGDTSYFYNMTNMTLISKEQAIQDGVEAHKTYTIPINELIPFFQERFPKCKITYEEREFRKGILIDWS